MKAFGAFLERDSQGVMEVLLQADQYTVTRLAFEWMAALKEAGEAPATRARRLGTLKAVGKFMRSTGLATWRIEKRGPKVQRFRDVRGPVQETIVKMFAACGDDAAGARDRAILGLLAIRGLRRAEVVGLRLKDYDRAGRRVLVLGKGDEEPEWVSLPPLVTDAIDRWVESAQHTSKDNHLFYLRPPGEKFALSSLNGIVRKIGERADVKVWPHALRHAAGTITAERGHDIRVVQGLLRHKQLQTTTVYIDRVKDLGYEAAADLAELFLGKPSP